MKEEEVRLFLFLSTSAKRESFLSTCPGGPFYLQRRKFYCSAGQRGPFSCDGCLQRPLCSTPLVFVFRIAAFWRGRGQACLWFSVAQSPEWPLPARFFETSEEGLNQKIENPVRKTSSFGSRLTKGPPLLDGGWGFPASICQKPIQAGLNMG